MTVKDIIGKTIIDAKTQKLSKHDDTGFLKLTFSDGTECVVFASYDFYTGRSIDEYPTRIFITDKYESKEGETLVDTNKLFSPRF